MAWYIKCASGCTIKVYTVSAFCNEFKSFEGTSMRNSIYMILVPCSLLPSEQNTILTNLSYEFYSLYTECRCSTGGVIHVLLSIYVSIFSTPVSNRDSV